MNSFMFWDITPCSSLKFNRCFGGKCRLCLQFRRISRGRNYPEEGSTESSGFGLFFDSEIEAKHTSDMSVALHGVMCRNVELFMQTSLPHSSLLHHKKMS
jgi:hypothetical protein